MRRRESRWRNKRGGGDDIKTDIKATANTIRAALSLLPPSLPHGGP